MNNWRYYYRRSLFFGIGSILILITFIIELGTMKMGLTYFNIYDIFFTAVSLIIFSIYFIGDEIIYRIEKYAKKPSKA